MPSLDSVPNNRAGLQILAQKHLRIRTDKAFDDYSICLGAWAHLH